VFLKPNQIGLHKIVVSDGGDMTLFTWSKGVPMTMPADLSSPLSVKGNFFFHVPRGTRVLGFFCNMHRGGIFSPDGKLRFKFSRSVGFHSIAVPKGMDGKVWCLRNVAGRIALMTVPPYLAVSPDELLLPKEVVEAPGG
jgi:hypothetical protein